MWKIKKYKTETRSLECFLVKCFRPLAQELRNVAMWGTYKTSLHRILMSIYEVQRCWSIDWASESLSRRNVAVWNRSAEAGGERRGLWLAGVLSSTICGHLWPSGSPVWGRETMWSLPREISSQIAVIQVKEDTRGILTGLSHRLFTIILSPLKFK